MVIVEKDQSKLWVHIDGEMSVLFCHIYFMLVGRHGGGKFTQGIFKLNHALNRQSWDYISVSGGSGNTGVGEHRMIVRLYGYLEPW